MEENKIITEFDSLIKSKLDNLLTSIDFEKIAKCKRLIILRSAPVNILEQFLKRLGEVNPDVMIFFVGKESDVESISNVWNQSYRLIGIEGSYTFEKIKKYQEALDEFDADNILFFSWVIPDESYMNIYELVEQMNIKNVFCCNFDMELMQIKEMRKYLSTLKVHLDMADWYWKMTNL